MALRGPKRYIFVRFIRSEMSRISTIPNRKTKSIVPITVHNNEPHISRALDPYPTLCAGGLVLLRGEHFLNLFHYTVFAFWIEGSSRFHLCLQNKVPDQPELSHQY